MSLHRQSWGCTAKAFRACSNIRILTLPWFIAKFVFLILCIRVGEAANPGPQGTPFHLGTINPTGLLGKGEVVSHLPRGAWGVTETHLTIPGVKRFRTELQFADDQWHFHATDHAPLTSNAMGCVGGKAVGVGLLSSFPSRNLQCDFDTSVRKEARIHAAAVCVNGIWIKFGAFYGYAYHALYTEVQNKSDELLAKLVDKVVFQSKGPRVVCGDFNQAYDTLPQVQTLLNAGFVELQQFAKQKWGREPCNTCKGKSIKDYVWISRELIPHLVDVTVDATWFADHSLVYGTFSPLSHDFKIPIWRRPKPVEWPSSTDNDDFTHNDTTSSPGEASDVDGALCSIFGDFEAWGDAKLKAEGQKGLLHNQRGRCCTKEVTWGFSQTTPPKLARRGEFVPSFSGENFTHYCWLRQLRRLQSLRLLLSTPMASLSKFEHAVGLWSAILRAKGFPRGFRAWWPSRSIVLNESPCNIPSHLPSAAIVQAIFDSFRVEFRCFESQLKSKQLALAKQRRLDDTHCIYRDVAKPRAIPVHTLVTKTSTAVLSVTDDNKSVQIASGIFNNEQPLFGPSGMLQTTAFSGDTLTFAKDPGLQAGDILFQENFQGTTAEVFEAFRNYWAPKWNRHASISEDRWDSFVQSCEHLLPTPTNPIVFEPITVDQWLSTVRSKKVHTATGPDGVSRVDLLSMPRTLCQRLVNLLNAIEQGQPWPSSLLVGTIAALEKVENAQDASQFRPICVFSLVYRTWASCRARQILDWLSAWAPEEILGSRPGCEAGSIWWRLACIIEEGFYTDSQNISGLSCDLSKCFNTLPRVPVFWLARKLGLPSSFVRTWHQAVAKMTRRFQVLGKTGPAMGACCGFPEGDPLSVVAMYLVNISMTVFLQEQAPRVTPWSFVDDWQLLSDSHEGTIQGFGAISHFATSLDLSLDPKKSFVWGSSAEARQALRQGELPIKYHCRNLGGHVSYCGRFTNYTVKNRGRMLDQFWPLLKRSVAPHPQKLLALKVVAWPRGLHAAAGTWLSQKWLSTLRTRALQALGLDKKGTNPMLQLSAVETVDHDPGFVVVWQTIWLFRRFAVHEVAFPLVSYILASDPTRYQPGPCGLFLQRLHQIAWAWLGDGYLRDHEGFVHHIVHCPSQLLKQRVCDAWQFMVGSELSRRDGFEGLEKCNFPLTVERLSHYSFENLGLLRVVLNGTFFTRDKQIHSGHFVDRACPWCHEPCDSVFHRHWECPHFQESRSAIPLEIFNKLQDMPECSLQHGWICTSHLLTEFRSCLHQAPDLTEDFLCDANSQEVLHLFTDGSCLNSKCQYSRVASWGVVCADIGNDTFVEVSHGPLWGLYQTIFRAECVAAISAIKFGLFTATPFWIWVDNKHVFDLLKRVRLGYQVQIHCGNKDHDLVVSLLELAHRAVSAKLFEDVVKVCSHQNHAKADSVIERWAFRGNDAADKIAEKGRVAFPSQTFHIWHALVQELDNARSCRDALHCHYIQVGQKAVFDKRKQQQVEPERWESTIQTEAPLTEDATISFQGFDILQPKGPLEFLGPTCHIVLQWMDGLFNTPEGKPVWTTGLHLLTDFQLHSQQLGVWRNSDTKCWEPYTDHMVGTRYDFLQAARQFAAYLRAVGRVFGVTTQSISRRPTGTSFRRWTKCMLVQMPMERVVQIDRIWFHRRISPIDRINLSFGGVSHFSST